MNFGDARLPDRFWEKAIPEPMTGCWLWTAGLSDGYARFQDGWKRYKAHRYSYVMLVGPVADGLDMDHKCRTTCCVNPAHLEPVTHRVNVQRGAAGDRQKAKTHCPKGHEYAGENLYVHGTNRQCRACGRARMSRKRRAA